MQHHQAGRVPHRQGVLRDSIGREIIVVVSELHDATLLPGEQVEDQGEQDTQNQAGRHGKDDVDVLALDVKIPWQAAHKRHSIAEPKQQAENNDK